MIFLQTSRKAMLVNVTIIGSLHVPHMILIWNQDFVLL